MSRKKQLTVLITSTKGMTNVNGPAETMLGMLGRVNAQRGEWNFEERKNVDGIHGAPLISFRGDPAPVEPI